METRGSTSSSPGCALGLAMSVVIAAAAGCDEGSSDSWGWSGLAVSRTLNRFSRTVCVFLAGTYLRRVPPMPGGADPLRWLSLLRVTTMVFSSRLSE
uniref:Putative secreted protein n=1 Tax=Ixodes ricinus TaxID=34613 RepID=A0A6B0U4N2_IXORI